MGRIWERVVPEGVQQVAGQARALGRTVMEEPTWGERAALGAAVTRGLGRALLHDLVIDPLVIARLNRERTATTVSPQLAEIVALPAAETREPMLFEAA